ncbi:MAG TPA: 3-deoxy-D-manno-octulosonic acid transferase [Desulfobacteraceae bacterium]|nr:3-deoxy-D-manno-octulosonic acid transferase [Desulfobacteraceae bacterium]
MLLYNLLWSLVLLVCLPAALLSGDSRFRGRFGLSVPGVPRKDRPVWVHALSVGEVYSALPLVKKIKGDCPETPVVFTATTRKGMAVAEKILSGYVDGLYYMPLDAWWSVERFVRFINPAVFVLVESDVWPYILDYTGRRGIKRLLVNGRVSPRTFRKYRMFPFASRRLFRGFDLCLMQSDLDLGRLTAVGVDSARVEVGGNIKFDRSVKPMDPQERTGWLDLLGFGALDPVIVAGSTHPGEEEILTRAFSAVRKQSPHARLIIAPRNIERAAEIESIAVRMNFTVVQRSRLPTAGEPDVVVVDTIGELGRLYGLATVGFVGGSLVEIGGHNPLEPAALGCPVLFGPYMHNFDAMARMLVEAGAGVAIANEAELIASLLNFLSDGLLRNETGNSALRFVETNRGAVSRAAREVKAMTARGRREDQL